MNSLSAGKGSNDVGSKKNFHFGNLFANMLVSYVFGDIYVRFPIFLKKFILF